MSPPVHRVVTGREAVVVSNSALPTAPATGCLRGLRRRDNPLRYGQRGRQP